VSKLKAVRKKLKVVKLKNQEEPKEVELKKRPLKNAEDGGAKKAPAQKRRR
jgi:hypothetical protein